LSCTFRCPNLSSVDEKTCASVPGERLSSARKLRELNAMDAKILIVEDESGLATILSDRFHKEGYVVTVARDGTSGLDLATREPFDLILLDIMLPGENGLTVCGKLRQRGSNTPILMLTARRQTSDKVVGLGTGADDYLTKPFQMAELLARVAALLRRAGPRDPTAGDRHHFGAVRIDLRRAEVSRDGRPVNLSAKEFQLLRYFLGHRGVVVSRDELLREVWGYGVVPSSRTVDVHVAWLRQKLEEDPKNPRFILTVIGLGYKFAG
jgi:two-component system, OmpR family, alkaline phosphatase synthesis response regulator PhoP